jgi:hypothetical protein
MSWWLSKPVQAYLDYQITNNKKSIEKVVDIMRKPEPAAELAVSSP